ncbi:PSP1 domain-containing protein [Filimonas lacunae]|nr:regulatory iron-sulfur-containing complex subunit RicT [Filimonas lacunae]BAV10102.1 signal peptidase-like protein [Filimonas lacunae]
MNVHDWLMNLPFSDPESSCKVVEVSFNKGSRKEYFRNNSLQYFEKGAYVTVEGVSGFDVGEISLTGELVRLQMKKKGVDEFNPDMKRILRQPSEKDVELFQQNKAREPQMLMRCRAIARQLNIQMKLSEVEIQADGKKATFFYTADDRVDFREMIKIYAGEFKVKVEMRQIGIRQEAAKVGGIGSCGRELCCSTWLTDFKSVTTTAARYQNLSINQTKLSGQCGRLKCCLNYELDTYLDALQQFPDNADTLETTRGTAHLIKKDIFKNLMWYVLPDSSKQYPLTIQRVKEIKRLNGRGEKVEELQAVELVNNKPKEIEPQFVDVVGQISLRSLERGSKRRKEKDHREQQQQRNDRKGGSGGGHNEREAKAERSHEPQQRGGGGGQQRNAGNEQQRQGNNQGGGGNNKPPQQQQQRNQQQKPKQQQQPQRQGGEGNNNQQQGSGNNKPPQQQQKHPPRQQRPHHNQRPPQDKKPPQQTPPPPSDKA